MVDRWILLQPVEADHELWRGWIQPADMFEQEGHHSTLVLGVVGCPSVLVFLERVLDLLGKFGEFLLLGDPKKFHRCRTGGKDKVLEALWLGGSKLCCEHGTPRVAQKVEIVVYFEVFEEVVEFGDEELDGPEVTVTVLLWEMGGHPAADLVVEDDRYLGFGPEIGEGEHVVVNNAWTSVKDDKRAVLSVYEIPVDLVPGLGGLLSARDDEIDLSCDEAFDGHDCTVNQLQAWNLSDLRMQPSISFVHVFLITCRRSDASVG